MQRLDKDRSGDQKQLPDLPEPGNRSTPPDTHPMTPPHLRQRQWRASTLHILMLLSLSGDVFAHAADRGFVLLLPTRYYLLGGAIAVAASVVLAALLRGAVAGHWRDAGWILPLPRRHGLRIATSTLALLALVLGILAGFFGSHDPLANPLPLGVWTAFWVVFTLLHACFGNLFALFNPWFAPVLLLRRLLPALPRDGLLRWPQRLAYWPAVGGFFLFAWFELVSLAPEDPPSLAAVVLIYYLVHLVASLLFGYRNWMHYGEPFAVLFRFISWLAPVTRVHRRRATTLTGTATPGHGSSEVNSYRSTPANPTTATNTASTANFSTQRRPDASGRSGIRFGWPGHRLLAAPALPWSGTVFVVMTLATVSFDGLNKTFWWLHLNHINPLAFAGRSSVATINTVGLIASVLVLLALYIASVLWGIRLAGRSNVHAVALLAGSAAASGENSAARLADASADTSAATLPPAQSEAQPDASVPQSNRAAAAHLLGRLALAILPISLAYHLAHYLTQLLVNGQYALLALADPLDHGWNLLRWAGFEPFQVSTSMLSHHASVERLWQLQVSTIVVGHIVAVTLAHLLAIRHFGNRRQALLSQLPTGALMIAYTGFGLWLLSTPTGA